MNLLCWFTCAFTYYGLALNTGNLAGDFYFNFIVNMGVDIPALLLSIPMFDRLGRARTLSVTLLVGGLACVAVTAVSALPIRSALAFVGKSAMHTLCAHARTRTHTHAHARTHVCCIV